MDHTWWTLTGTTLACQYETWHDFKKVIFAITKSTKDKLQLTISLIMLFTISKYAMVYLVHDITCLQYFLNRFYNTHVHFK